MEYLVCTGVIKNAHTIFFFRQPQGEGSYKRRMHGRANNIKMDLREIEFETGNM
jgi:hypothetical protein